MREIVKSQDRPRTEGTSDIKEELQFTIFQTNTLYFYVVYNQRPTTTPKRGSRIKTAR